MDNITVGQISVFAAAILALWVTIESLTKKISALFTKVLDEKLDDKFKAINDRLDEANKKLEKTDKNATMNYLVRCMDDMDKHEKLEGASRRRFLEQYEHYTNDLGGNSYIKEEFERLKKEGKF